MVAVDLIPGDRIEILWSIDIANQSPTEKWWGATVLRRVSNPLAKRQSPEVPTYEITYDADMGYKEETATITFLNGDCLKDHAADIASMKWRRAPIDWVVDLLDKDCGLGQLQPELFSDITLQVDTASGQYEDIRAHKVVLSAYSEYFSSLFSSGMQESRAEVVKLVGDPPGSMQALVAVMYGRRVKMESAEELVGLIEVAAKYQASKVQAMLEGMMKKRLTPSTLKSFYASAKRLSLPDVASACEDLSRRLLQQEPEQVTACPLDLVVKLLGSWDIGLTETAKASIVTAWVQGHDAGDDEGLCAQLLGCLCFEDMSERELTQLLRGSMCDNLKESSFAKLLIENVREVCMNRLLEAAESPAETTPPVVENVDGTFTVVVSKVDLAGAEVLTSEAFYCCGFKWHLLVYPKGKEANRCMSVYLKKGGQAEETPHMHFKVQVGSKVLELTQRFTKEEDTWGWSHFLPSFRIPPSLNSCGELHLNVEIRPDPESGSQAGPSTS